MRQACRVIPILPALFALAIQSLAIQPHVHLTRLSLAAMSPAGDVTNTGLPKGKPSPGGDSANCPLCQAAARGGDAVLPTVVAISTPALAPDITSWAATPQRISALSHDWCGRAPPQA
jgi:hypothetical protein